MKFRRRALFLAGLLAAVSCSDAGNPLTPGEPRTPLRPDDALQTLRCTADVRAGTVSCAVPSPTGDASGLLVGGQNLHVRMTATNVGVDADTFRFDATVTNLIAQALGTTDGATLDPEGVRVFFLSDPVGQPSGTVTVANETGTDFFTSAGQAYFQYDEVLHPGDESAPMRWQLHFTPEVTTISFLVAISADVQYPDGWVDLGVTDDTLEVGQSVDVSGPARDVLGRTATVSQSITYATTGRATTVDPSTGVVTATALGTDTITASNGTQTGTAIILVNDAPVFYQDSVVAVNRVQVTDTLVIPSLDADPVVPVADTITTSSGGTAWIGVDSIVQYVSALGFTGQDTVDFALTDGVHVSAARLIVTVAEGNYWFVRPGVSGGDGRSHAPFATLASAAAAADAGDTLFVVPNGVQQVDGGVGLKDGQAIIGAGIAASFDRVVDGRVIRVLEAAGAPGLTNTAAGPTITLGQNNTIRGVGITAGDGAAITGSGFGTLTVSHTAVNPRGPALHLTSGTLDAAFAVLSSDSSNTEGLYLDGVGGTLTVAGGQIRHPDGTAFRVNGGAGLIFEYPGDVSNSAGALAMVSALAAGDSIVLAGALTDSGTGIGVTGATGGTALFSGTLALSGRGIDVSGNTGGSIHFTGASKTLTVGANPGVSLVGNTGATILFGGGNLAITGLDSVGFRATGGGTVEVTGSANTISTGTGTALVLNGVGTGTSGVSFASVSNTGAANGIVADAVTGAGFQVTGTGSLSPGSGGVIRKPTGHGIVLNGLGSAQARLAFVDLDSAGTGGNAGLFASGSDSIVVQSVTIDAVGGPAVSASSGRIHGVFSELSSQNSASSGVILSSMGGSVQATGGSITNAAGTGFAIAGGGVSTEYAGGITQGANNAALVAVSGGHTGTATFQTGTLQATTGTGLQFTDADGTYAFTGSTVLNGGDAGIDVVGGSSGTFTFGAGTGITSPTGAALLVSASAPASLTFAGAISTGPGAGRPVQVEGMTGGVVDVTGNVTSAGRGILIQNNTGGTLAFGGIKSLTTGLDSAVVMRSNTGHAVQFTNGNLDITTAGGDGIFATGGGTLSFTGAGSDFSTGTGTALNLTGVVIGTASELGTVNTSGAPNGIRLVSVVGPPITIAGGTLTGAAAGAPVHVSGGTASLTFGGGITQAATNALVSVLGAHSGTLSFTGTLSATGGTGLQFNDADGTYQFTGTATLNGGDAGIDIINSSSGTFAFGANVDITNSTGPAFFVSLSSPASVTMAGDIATGPAAGRPVLLSNAGGTLAFSGGITSTGQGIRLESGTANVTFSGAVKALNTGANTAFQMMNHAGSVLVSGGSLDIDTNGATGVLATGGGSLQVTGAGNAVNAVNGAAVHVDGVTIGASGLNFQRVDASNGANGILLRNTGAQGMQVTGNTSGNCGGDANASPFAAAPYGSRTLPDAADCSGGLLSSTVGADGTSGGAGVYLENASNVSLTRMRIAGTHQNYGIRGVGVSNLTLDNVQLDGVLGNNIGADEGGVSLFNLSGTAAVRNSYFAGAAEHDFEVRNTAAVTLNRATFDNVTFGIQTQPTASDHLVLISDGAGTLNATVQNSRFMGARGDMFQFIVQNSATSDLVVQNNVFYNQHGSIVSGGGGTGIAIGAAASDPASLTYAVTGNRFRGANGAAFGVQKGSGTGTATGTVTNNIVGDVGVANSGSAVGNGMAFILARSGKSKVLVDGNQVYQYNGNSGVYFLAGGATGTNTGSLHATVRRNTVSTPGTNNPGAFIDGLRFDAGTNNGDAYTMCLDVGQGAGNANNIVNGGRAGFGDPFSFIANIPGAVPIYKLAGYPATTDAGIAAHANVQSTVGPANGGVTGYMEMPNSTTTYATNSGTGAACDLF